MVDPIQERNLTENGKAKAQKRSCSDELLGEFQKMQQMKVMLQRNLGMLCMTSEEQQKVRSSTTRELFPGTSTSFLFLRFYFLFHFLSGTLSLDL